MQQFPRAAVTKHHKAGDLKQQKFIVLILEATGPKSRCQQGRDFPGGPVVKNPPANAGEMGSIPGSGNQDPTCHGATKPSYLNQRSSVCHSDNPGQPKILKLSKKVLVGPHRSEAFRGLLPASSSFWCAGRVWRPGSPLHPQALPLLSHVFSLGVCVPCSSYKDTSHTGLRPSSRTTPS